MSAPVLMVLGTASSVGKSTLVTALCRIAARRGIRVAPFKGQNMSNNAAVTADGGEVARSIAVQAAAARIEPTVQMNPVLIKPEGDRRSHIVVEGRPWRTLDAQDYWQRKKTLWEVVARNMDALRSEYDLVIAEGAGSPVELNLKPRDIANMRVATYTRARTLLVGDIDVGGIFAALLGTLMLLDDDERALLRGLVVNRFRGDPALFTEGVVILEQRSGLPALGIIPWLDDLGIAEEDAVALERPRQRAIGNTIIAVIQLPTIANFDDLDPLVREPDVEVRYIDRPEELSGAAAVVLPGTKHTLAARRWLCEREFDAALLHFRGAVVGLCGGYQLLGTRISDPFGVEGTGGDEPGLGLLPIATVFSTEKRTVRVEARAHAPWAPNAPILGYEIHMGRTTVPDEAVPLATITQRGTVACAEMEGCQSFDGRVWGCYIHGLFANEQFRRGWLRTLGWHDRGAAPPADLYERLADHIAANLDERHLEELFA
jgi:adenosylcobyric acid synthase